MESEVNEDLENNRFKIERIGTDNIFDVRGNPRYVIDEGAKIEFRRSPTYVDVEFQYTSESGKVYGRELRITQNQAQQLAIFLLQKK